MADRSKIIVAGIWAAVVTFLGWQFIRRFVVLLAIVLIFMLLWYQLFGPTAAQVVSQYFERSASLRHEEETHRFELEKMQQEHAFEIEHKRLAQQEAQQQEHAKELARQDDHAVQKIVKLEDQIKVGFQTVTEDQTKLAKQAANDLAQLKLEQDGYVKLQQKVAALEDQVEAGHQIANEDLVMKQGLVREIDEKRAVIEALQAQTVLHIKLGKPDNWNFLTANQQMVWNNHCGSQPSGVYSQMCQDLRGLEFGADRPKDGQTEFDECIHVGMLQQDARRIQRILPTTMSPYGDTYASLSRPYLTVKGSSSIMYNARGTVVGWREENKDSPRLKTCLSMRNDVYVHLSSYGDIAH